ncbi:ATP-dependent DNA ligase [Romeria aff. gracilis LEGE 07310]|uniref:DNA ligase (ATP) n=1 Tax=Vasconcelosia minhoensis LEGE 07310 TaxID=915328 RepID=A0A8J7DQA4_9CYAN|nr:ATP-dependent DNA ligase [Romeria gracilis]MBE9076204.1 ATP-dependent DNA ligase [Romeria aff. gracilis LEGE 07310]
MRRFTQLFQEVDATTSTNEKIKALQRYFHDETAENAVWAIYLFLSKSRKRLITSRILREIFQQISDIPPWLIEDCYAHVGDSAETIALLLKTVPLGENWAESPSTALSASSETPLHVWMERVIPQVKQVSEEARQALIIDWWANLDDFEIFVLNKILTGAFRVGASNKLVIKALAAEYDLTEAVLTHRLMGEIQPTAEFYQRLIQQDAADTQPSQPYPFFLAAQIEADRFQQETLTRWQAEWKWDGIRGQIIHRADQVFIWSRGEDLITHQFPEFEDYFLSLPNGLVLDGEILCWDGQRPLDFNYLQKRLGRKRVTAKLMAENPVHFLAYDLLEQGGEDLRNRPFQERRARLTQLLDEHPSDRVSYSQPLPFKTFEDLQELRQQAREQGAEGLMLKALDSPYLAGRKRGYWWKYKVDPMTLDAVLIYAQAGSGKRANLFTDYTFALWHQSELVPFAKAYSGLDNAEIEVLDRWIRRHTKERFGPVRSVEPTQVFEIGFEGISESKRHKSGISVRFPRILRWRQDKPMAEADTLESAIALL